MGRSSGGGGRGRRSTPAQQQNRARALSQQRSEVLGAMADLDSSGNSRQVQQGRRRLQRTLRQIDRQIERNARGLAP